MNNEQETIQTDNKSQTWDTVKAYTNEKTNGGAAMSLIETEKILTQLLTELKVPGKNLTEQIENIDSPALETDTLLSVHKDTQKLIHELHTEITPTKAEQALEVYLEKIKTIAENKKSIKTPLGKRIKTATSSIRKKVLLTLGALLGFFFIIYLVDSTELGAQFGELLISISRFIFSWVLATIILAIAVIIAIITTMFYFEKRRESSKLRSNK